MYMLKLRPDAHPGAMAYQARGGDCLHFCLPGPLDIFSHMLLHHLFHLRRANATQRLNHQRHSRRRLRAPLDAAADLHLNVTTSLSS